MTVPTGTVVGLLGPNDRQLARRVGIWLPTERASTSTTALSPARCSVRNQRRPRAVCASRKQAYGFAAGGGCAGKAALSVTSVSTEKGLPAAVERLLREHASSVAKVELLLVLREAGTRPLEVGSVAADVGCPDSWAAKELERWRRCGVAQRDADGRYAYRPGSEEMRAAVEALARLWYRDRRTVTRWLFARRSRRTPPRG